MTPASKSALAITASGFGWSALGLLLLWVAVPEMYTPVSTLAPSAAACLTMKGTVLGLLWWTLGALLLLIFTRRK